MNSYRGQNIGNGKDYSGNTHPSIIIGQWDRETTPEVVCQQNSIDKTNFLHPRN